MASTRCRLLCGAVAAVIKLNIEAGKANPSPPVGPALGAAGVNIMDFCKQYNAATQDKAGEMVPAEISVMDVRAALWSSACSRAGAAPDAEVPLHVLLRILCVMFRGTAQRFTWAHNSPKASSDSLQRK